MDGFSPWSSSTVLGSVRHRLLMALSVSLGIWIAILWASVGVTPNLMQETVPPTDRVVAEPAPPRSYLRAAAVAATAAADGGSYNKFGIGMRPAAAAVNAAGDIVFFASLARGQTDEALFLSHNGVVSRIAGTGTAVPGGGTISGFTEHPAPALNGPGTAVFAASIEGGHSSEALFAWTGGRLTAIAQSGTRAAGPAGGAFFDFGPPAINDAGEVVFLATIRRGRETSDAIYLASKGKLTKVVAAGDPAPGGGTFSGLGAPALNKFGMVAFAAVVEQSTVPGGIFIATNGEFRRVVGAGDPSPGGGMFARLGEHVGLDDAGRIGFVTILSGETARAGVFIKGEEGATAVATIGMAAPEGGTFASFAESPSLAAGGQLAFLAAVDGGSGASGVFALRPTGLARVATVGDALEDGRRIAYFPLSATVTAGPGGAVVFQAGIQTGDDQTDALLVFSPPPH